jgi:hypothetical protein
MSSRAVVSLFVGRVKRRGWGGVVVDACVYHDAVIGMVWAGFWQGGLGSMKGVSRKSGAAATAAGADASLLNRFVVPAGCTEPAPAKTGNDWTRCVVFLGYPAHPPGLLNTGAHLLFQLPS